MSGEKNGPETVFFSKNDGKSAGKQWLGRGYNNNSKLKRGRDDVIYTEDNEFFAFCSLPTWYSSFNQQPVPYPSSHKSWKSKMGVSPLLVSFCFGQFSTEP